MITDREAVNRIAQAYLDYTGDSSSDFMDATKEILNELIDWTVCPSCDAVIDQEHKAAENIEARTIWALAMAKSAPTLWYLGPADHWTTDRERRRLFSETEAQIQRAQIGRMTGKGISDIVMVRADWPTATESDEAEEILLEAKVLKRKVWLVQLDSLASGVGQVMIEQYGDKPPAVAFRSWSDQVWGPPHQSRVAP